MAQTADCGLPKLLTGCLVLHTTQQIKQIRQSHNIADVVNMRWEAAYLGQKQQQLKQQHPQPGLYLLCLLISGLQRAVCIVKRFIGEDGHKLHIRPLRCMLHLSMWIVSTCPLTSTDTEYCVEFAAPGQKERYCPLSLEIGFRSSGTCCKAHQKLAAA